MLEITVKPQKNELLTQGRSFLERYVFDSDGNHTVFEITKNENGYKVIGQGAEFQDTSITRIRKICDMLANEYFIAA